MAGAVMVLEGLGRLTKVGSVQPCPQNPKMCCAKQRVEGRASPGEFAAKCAIHKPSLTVAVGGKRSHEPPPEAAPGTGDITMARHRKHRRHTALAEYGEPFGEIGLIGDLLDTRDLKEFGFVALGGVATVALVPKLTKLWNNVPSLGKALPYVKGITGIAGGFLLYKYGGRKVPAKYHDLVVASSAIMAGLGVATIAHEIFDQGAIGGKLKELHGLGDLFPVSLSNVGPDEHQLLAALGAIEDQTLMADMDPSFSDVFTQDTLDATVSPEELAADVDPEGSWTQYSLDASVSSEDDFLYGEGGGEVDLDVLAMQGAQ